MQQFLLALAAGSLLALVAATLLASLLARIGFPLPPDNRRIGCIDGLRGYLALAVMIHHFFIWIQSTRLGGDWSQPSIHMLNQLGAGSVGLFFMITGLVFYPRILAGLRGTSLSTLFLNRLFRIIPLVTFSVALVTLIVIARTGTMPDSRYVAAATQWIVASNQVPLLDYVESGRINAYVLWSLGYEWLFYLFLLPVCAAAMDVVRDRRLPTWTVPVALLFVTGVTKLVIGQAGSAPALLNYIPLFAIGMFAFECQARPEIRAVLSKPVFAIPAAAALLSGMIATPIPYGAALPLFGFFFVCVACGNGMGGLLRTRGALVLGECSFGIYLLHGIVLDVLFVEGHTLSASLPITALPILLPFAAIAVVLITPATHLLIERPAMRYGKTLARRIAQRPATLDAGRLEAGTR